MKHEVKKLIFLAKKSRNHLPPFIWLSPSYIMAGGKGKYTLAGRWDKA